MKDARGPGVLVVNPGSTSTKVALFRGCVRKGEASLPVPQEGRTADPWDEFTSRLEEIRSWLEDEGIGLSEVEAVVGRGGLLRPMEGGTYRVSEAMLADARAGRQGVHASNLGCALALALADGATRARQAEMPGWQGGDGPKPGVPAFVVDPVSTDEFTDSARVSGLAQISRRSLSHALSIHALVRQVCERDQKKVEDSRFVVGHLGGGISVCPVVGGRILDASNANSGGPFSPTRAGGLPTQELLDLAFGGGYSSEELRELTLRKGGLTSYLGTADATEVEARIQDGDDAARKIYEAMAYQIAKEIGAMATVVEGGPERILLTGGLAASSLLTGWIRERVAFLAPVEIWPEVEEMNALALGALRVLQGDEPAKEY